MFGVSRMKRATHDRTRRWFVTLAVAASAALGACSTSFDKLGTGMPETRPTEQPPPSLAGQIGNGQIRVALILPLSAPGNAGLAALSMKNAAEMALAEFKNPNIQLLVKDDA